MELNNLENRIFEYIKNVATKRNTALWVTDEYEIGLRYIPLWRRSPYQGKYTIAIPGEPLNNSSMTTVELSLVLHDIESLGRTNARQCIEKIQDRIKHFNAEIEILQDNGYHGFLDVTRGDPFLCMRYDITTPTQFHIWKLLNDFLIPVR